MYQENTLIEHVHTRYYKILACQYKKRFNQKVIKDQNINKPLYSELEEFEKIADDYEPYLTINKRRTASSY
ncbi:hypothetical protein HZS_399 [Henneguya salminicola]|nr:hypothetical protein HZS_399 [Henneguya salminicola]